MSKPKSQYASAGKAPYFVTWTRQGTTSKVYESWQSDDCIMYANDHITHGGITERIEVHDYTGPLCAIYDKSWNCDHPTTVRVDDYVECVDCGDTLER